MAKTTNRSKELIEQYKENDDFQMPKRLTKEEKESLKRIAQQKKGVRHLIDQYYQVQGYRIKSGQQTYSIEYGNDESPDIAEQDQSIFDVFTLGAMDLEKRAQKYLIEVCKHSPICKWMTSIIGVGPVFAAFFYATLDVTQTRYPTQFISYCGLNDMNNPWLGKDGSTRLTNEIVDQREEAFAYFQRNLKAELPEKVTAAKFKKLLSVMGKDAINTVSAGDGIIVPEKHFITALNSTGIDLPTSTIYDIAHEHEEWLAEWLCVLGKSNYAGQTTFDLAATLTKRKPELVTKGIKSTRDVKTKKLPYCTIDDVRAYLAKPPYNPKAKKTCRLLGESFKKMSGNPKSLYGRLYRERKLREENMNNNGLYAEAAARELESKNYRSDKEAYETLSSGRLTQGHLDARAMRIPVKIFLSHLWEAMWWEWQHTTPVPYYAFEHLGHHDYIAPEVPYKPFFPDYTPTEDEKEIIRRSCRWEDVLEDLENR